VSLNKTDMETIKEKISKAFEALKESQGYTNVMQAPRLVKVVVSAGVGKKRDKKQLELISDRLAQITGQKASVRPAKVSVAGFKLREGETVGFQITLRGQRMNDFLEKLIHIALPRTKDFRGISIDSADEMGNYTFGIKEHTIFPETADEEIKDIFSLAVTLVTTAKTKPEVQAFLKHLGMPFREPEAKK
jgi:large subunit ribosomal protein L5